MKKFFSILLLLFFHFAFSQFNATDAHNARIQNQNFKFQRELVRRNNETNILSYGGPNALLYSMLDKSIARLEKKKSALEAENNPAKNSEEIARLESKIAKVRGIKAKHEKEEAEENKQSAAENRQKEDERLEKERKKFERKLLRN